MSAAGSPCLSQVCFVFPVCPHREADSLLHEPGGGLAGTFGLAGTRVNDAWACATAYSDGEERDVHGREH